MSQQPKIHGKKLMLYIWWYQLAVVYYQLLKLNETIIEACYRNQIMRFSRILRERHAHYYSKYDKILLENAQPQVAVLLKIFLVPLNWEVLMHLWYLRDIAPFDYPLFRLMTYVLPLHMTYVLHHFISYENNKDLVDP
ncbi:mariner Mos1 transposase [Trichonephila clavipes]|nr:mariner Mos1 transposase [Trichonephila clavipes]